MSHRSGDDLAGDPLLQKMGKRLFLGFSPGEQEGGAGGGVLDGIYHKGYRLSYPGKDGDVPGDALGNAQSGLLPGDPPGKRSYPDQQVVVLIAEESGALQYLLRCHGTGQSFQVPTGRGVFRGVEYPALWKKAVCQFYQILSV